MTSRLSFAALMTSVLAAAGLAGTGLCADPARSGAVQVTIRDEQPVVVEAVAPLDPVRRIQYQASQLGVAVRSEANQTLHLSHFPSLLVDGQFNFQPGGRSEFVGRQLPPAAGKKNREGFMSAHVLGDLRITTTVTVVPTRPAARQARRRLDSLLIHYLLDNKGQQAHKVGFRVYMDTYIIDNDGCLFAAPTVPDKILDGTILKDKLIPPYLKLLQRPDLKNPGFVAHLTFDLGHKLPKPDRVVMTRHGQGFGSWEMPAMMAMGDSAVGIFWDPLEIKPGGKRELAYAYGQGIATSPESEGRVELALGGSFEPGKRFNVTAYVTDPAAGQFLTLELPQGMALVEGRASQPVPATPLDEPSSMVVWQARVLQPGEYAVRVRSSTGVTQGKHITIARAGT